MCVCVYIYMYILSFGYICKYTKYFICGEKMSMQFHNAMLHIKPIYRSGYGILISTVTFAMCTI